MRMRRMLYMALCAVLLVSLLAVSAMAAGLNVDVITSYEVEQGEVVDLYCAASSDSGGELSYIWYETTTGKMEDMFAVNRGTETFATFRCDTSQVGTRYYLCSVNDGEAAIYSDIITVRVTSGTDSRPVVFTTDSEPVTGGQMTVDIKRMIDYDAGLYNAFMEGQIGYEWYRDEQKVKNETGTMKFTDADAGCFFHVIVKGYDIELKSEDFRIEKLIVPPEIKTSKLPEATVGEKYSTQLKCYDDVDAEFVVYYNPGKANQFDDTGLTLKENGKLSGTPTKAGEFTFTVCAGNEGGEDYATYTLVVKEPATEPTETTEATTAPTTATTPTTPEASKPIEPEQNTTVMAPATGELNETGTGSGAPRLAGGMILIIVLVILLAVVAAAAAAVIIIILIVKRRK